MTLRTARSRMCPAISARVRIGVRPSTASADRVARSVAEIVVRPRRSPTRREPDVSSPRSPGPSAFSRHAPPSVNHSETTWVRIDATPGSFPRSAPAHGTSTVTVPEIAAMTNRKSLTVPAAVLKFALRIGRALGSTEHGPERVAFLQYRPVLDNRRLREELGVPLRYTSREALEAYLLARAEEDSVAAGRRSLEA
ncbi:hypothetical protein RBB84_08780 [Rhodococcus sp. D-6]|uniref:Uncharacterized protein n=2 Tax=Rhodococcus TaxID=1827 RepID=A0AAU7V1D3_9NOCA|nr:MULTISPECIES: hypothetical protein [unclassified Rhodococcus (in: high G+C Gram-positive bacteria)]